LFSASSCSIASLRAWYSLKLPGQESRLPRSSSTMRVATRSRKRRSWVMNTSVTPELTSISSSHSMAPTSRWLVGSSSSNSSGEMASAWASARRFFWPPESVPTRRVGIEREALDDALGLRLERPRLARLEFRLQRVHALQQSFLIGAGLAEGVRNRMVLGEQGRHFAHAGNDGLENRQLGVKRRFLRHVTDAQARLQPDLAIVEPATTGERAQGATTCRCRCGRSAPPFRQHRAGNPHGRAAARGQRRARRRRESGTAWAGRCVEVGNV
jgi:hypothetical protein